MSEGPDLSELEALAAEHALGLLTARERAEVEARAAREPAFAALIDAWRQRLAPMLDAVTPVAPDAAVWARVERALPVNDNGAVRRRLRFWRGATVGSAGLAAASLAVAVMLANRPPVLLQAPPPAPILNASLMSQADSAQPMFVAAYDPARQALIVTSLVPPGGDPTHVHELWIIPADGKPHPIGMIEPGKSKAMPMPKDMVPMFAPGSSIAVSVEPPGGSPTRTAPSGPIAAMGMLDKI
ncbi:anti-sigma factor [Phenylobacterium sp. LjRoot225]|uniref:anti-sigma factor n=1 Tax=Phenylobacterium sp. LjRoot225 TaxID=3342285 RepID=UPI003ECD6775